jgi:hypothetical protein
MKPSVAGPTAALAGIPAGIQSQGVWGGRRQLFVRFAAEAETATMYTADALANEIGRATTRSAFHSICIGGRDPLANCEYIVAAFAKAATVLPVMLDCDGQRPDSIAELHKILRLVQVTLDGAMMASDVHVQCAIQSLQQAANASMEHALTLVADERTSDAVLLRIVEQTHATTAAVQVVLHAGTGVPVDRDRRWTTLIERASVVHSDIRFALRLPPPTGMR